MPDVALHGGGAAKVSNWFEEAWTLYTVVDMLAGFATAMTLEPPGTANQGLEFSLDRMSRREWHQVKFHEGRQGKWTLARLHDEKVLSAFRDKLAADPKEVCWFISADSTYPMNRLCAHAAKAATLRDLKGTFLSNDEFRKAFGALRDEYWKVGERKLWQWLRERVVVRTVDDPFLNQTLRERVQTFITGDVDAVIEVLREILKEHLYVPLERGTLEAELTTRGHAPRDWTQNAESLEDQVAATSRGFVDVLAKQLIHQSFIAREQVGQIEALLDQTHPPGVILVSGAKGNGKSAVLAEVVQKRLGSPWRVLTLDAARLSHEDDTDAVATTLGLPMRPAAALAGVARGRRGLFIVEGMDRVSVNKTQRPELFTVLASAIKEARAHQNLVLVISCRSEDLHTDERLRGLADDLGAKQAPPRRRVPLPQRTIWERRQHRRADSRSARAMRRSATRRSWRSNIVSGGCDSRRPAPCCRRVESGSGCSALSRYG